MADSVGGGLAFSLMAAARTLFAVTIFAPSLVAKPGAGGMGRRVAAVDCDGKPYGCHEP